MKTIKINENWCFFAEDFNGGQQFFTDIPSSAQYALFRQGVIPDYNFALNEGKYYELENKTWIFSKSFFIEDIDFAAQRLIFKGIDTFSAIYLNDIFLGSTENMFLKYIFDVKGILKQGENVITVRFDKILDRLDKLVQAEQHAPLNYSMDKRRPYARKMQCSWGWDWGPRILETGIWKEVELELFNDGYVEDVAVKLEDAQSDLIRIYGSVEKLSDNLTLKADIRLEGKVVKETDLILNNNSFDSVIKLDELLLWYPNGYGKQNLYNIKITLLSEGMIEQIIYIETGFREVKLIQEDDGEGKSFLFEINGIKIFAKGANWIPADAFINRISEEDYIFYIEKAVSMNMNMLRIWGGGIYENDVFYRECNRKGIMVWQDFMFACAEYPDHNDSFANSVKLEAEQAVKRLKNNPCIVLYCGNNENNWLMQLYYNKRDDYMFGGNRIYKNLLKETCSNLDDSVPYWISSPYSEEGDCNSQLNGDMHSWDVYCFWAETGCYEQVNGKFISEFGFQGAASGKTVYEYTPQDQRSIYSDVSFAHNKCYEGTEHCVKYLYTEVGGFNDFDSYINLLQFIQGEAIKLGIEHWRSRKFKTAGTLYWQFNDNWCCTSFSSIDYKKRNKALYYYTKRFYDDMLVTMKNTDKDITVTVTNDRLNHVSGKLTIKAYRTNGELLNTKEINVDVESNDICKVYEGGIFDFVNAQGLIDYPQYYYGTVHANKIDKAFKEVIFFTELTVGDKTYHNYKILTKHRRLNLEEPDITYSVIENKVILKSRKPAAGVYVEADTDVQFDDNFITMEPGREYILTADNNFNTINVTNVFSMTNKAI